jgi:hypothetical protein
MAIGSYVPGRLKRGIMPLLVGVILYGQENENSALFIIPSHKIIILNSVCSIHPVRCMKSPLGGVKPSLDRLCVRVDCPYPPAPSNHMTGVW